MSKNCYILRADLNVPLYKGQIADTQRIDAVVPTINDILSDPKFNRLVIISHFGRPDGRYSDDSSLKPVYDYMKQLTKDLTFVQYKENYEDFFHSVGSSGVYLLDNIRFYREEEDLDEKFSKCISELGNIFIMDAFATIHREHSSTVGPVLYSSIETRYGLLVKREIDMFDLILNNDGNDRKKLAILGGAKVSDKIKLIENMIDKVDSIIIGGGMAFTFLKVLFNRKIGDSLFDQNGIDVVKDIVSKCNEKNVKLYLPVDFVINNRFDNKGDIKTVYINESEIPDGYMGLDIGPKSIDIFKNVVSEHDVLIWNGPMGVFEFESFEKGSRELSEQISKLTIDNQIISIIGGGDTAYMCEKFNNADKMSFVSTGGGASLKLLGGELNLHIK